MCVHACAFVCMHASGKPGGELACWDCPTAFPVFIQHPYSAPVCLATGSYQEQTQWANILRAATHHQSSGIVLLPLFPIMSQKQFPHASMPLSKLFFSPFIPLIMYCLLALWCEDSPESRACLDAVSSLKKLRGNCQTEVHPMGDREEVSNHQTRCHPQNLFVSHKSSFSLLSLHFKLCYFLSSTRSSDKRFGL